MIYESQRVRKFIGGKWGHITGWLFGKRWVRLSAEAVMWDENWDLPRDCIQYRYSIFRIDEHGMLLRRDLADPAGTWYAIVQL